MKAAPSRRSGFTLLEIIVTLTVTALLSLLLVQFMETGMARSVTPLRTVTEAISLQGVFETMQADYKHLLFSDPTPLATFQARVQEGHYGTYRVIQNGYIRFDAERQEAPCDLARCQLLKVTIALGDQKLTGLFAQ